jgi:hypothetical protein
MCSSTVHARFVSCDVAVSQSAELWFPVGGCSQLQPSLLARYALGNPAATLPPPAIPLGIRAAWPTLGEWLALYMWAACRCLSSVMATPRAL